MHFHNLVHFLTVQNPLCCDNMLTEIRRREQLLAFFPGMRKETKNEIAISESAAGERLKRKSTLNGVNTNCCEKPAVAVDESRNPMFTSKSDPDFGGSR